MFKAFPLLLLLTINLITNLYGDEPSNHAIQWTSNYSEAVEKAQKEDKALLLYFAGSDWCAWCMKLDKEVFEDPAFSKALNDKLVFVLLDFPQYSAQAAQLRQQNRQLLKRFKVRGFPTILVLDQQQQLISLSGYRAGGGASYADYLLGVLDNYSDLQEQSEEANLQSASGEKLVEIYKKATVIGQQKIAQAVIQAGLRSRKSPFFLKEHYRQIALADNSTEEQVDKVRNLLLKSDPDNQHATHYEVAVIDHQKLVKKEPQTPDSKKALAPLLSYLQIYGKQDNDNAWKVHMTIAQYLTKVGSYKEALQHAEESIAMAPEEKKEELQKAINFLKVQTQ